MSREKPDKRPSPFCRQGWKLPLVVLTIACMGTFAWAVHLVWEHRGDLGGVNYIYTLQDPPPAAVGAVPRGVGSMPGGGTNPAAGVASAPVGVPPAQTLPQAAGVPPARVLPQAGGVAAMPNMPVGVTQPVVATNPAATVRAALVSIAGFKDTGANTPGELVGSGVLIGGEGYVATAAHLIESWKQLRVRVVGAGGAREFAARPLKVIAEHNLALLKLATTESFPYLTPLESGTLPSPGTKVTAWGDDRAGSVIAQAGTVAGTPTTVTVGGRSYHHLIPTDGLLYHWAQSGGPLLDDQGRLLGIDMVFQDANGAMRGYFVPAVLLRAHFRDILAFPPPAAGGGGGLLTPGGGMTTPDRGEVGYNVPAALTVAALTPLPGSPATGTQPGAGGVAAVGTGATNPAAALARRPADQWWEQARQKIQQTFYLRVNDPPFDLSGFGSGDAGHLRANQVFGYPLSVFLGMLLLGFVSGVSGGMMTMGGGIIKVTGLMAIFGYGIVLVRPVAYITNIFMYGAAALRYKKSGLIDWPGVKPMVPWAMAGMVGGYYVGTLLDTAVIRVLLGLFALAVGAKMLREIWERRKRGAAADPRDDDNAGDAFVPRPDPGAGAGLLGLPMGVVSGILGITGGVVEVPLQRYVNGVSLRVAIANSAILVFFASMVGSVVAMVHGGVTGAFATSTPLVMAMILLPGAYLGGMLGSWLTTVVPMDVLRWIYATFMFIIAGRMWTE
ncbi:MAG: TSUP family transporter [Magnetococcales bacterium]|nr:TSUP family transporter [Magnetococcales bacterium]